MKMTAKRIFIMRHFKAGKTGLRAPSLAMLAAVLGVGVTAVTPHQTHADECLLDTNSDGTATTGVDSALGANSAGDNSRLACGNGASATATNALALGNTSEATAANTVAIGIFSDATAIDAVAIGNSSEATAAGAVAVGRTSDAFGVNSVAIGNSSDAIGANAIAIGINSDAAANGGTAIGDNTSATFASSAAFGEGATATRVNQQVFGTATNTYTFSGVTSAASTAAQGAVAGLVTTDASGNLASDGGALQTQVDNNSTNIAAFQNGDADLRNDVDDDRGDTAA